MESIKCKDYQVSACPGCICEACHNTYITYIEKAEAKRTIEIAEVTCFARACEKIRSVHRGVRAVTSLQYHNRVRMEIDKALSVSPHVSAYHVSIDENWREVYFYRTDNAHMLQVILATLQKQDSEYDETVFMHWVRGKMFGYSEDAIRKYINKLEKYSINE